MYSSIKKIFRYVAAIILILGGIVGLFIPIPGLFFLIVFGLYLFDNQWINSKLKFILDRFKKRKISDPFVSHFRISPRKEGRLKGMHFAVSDLLDITHCKTGAGNPTWSRFQFPAAAHAFAVEQLLDEGARCAGKTITDEFGFSLIGENHFFGAPLNPKAPDRVPGGAASGAASAVAAHLIDFAIATDAGGAVRVPASNCGIYGFRPSHGKISVAGMHPFAPTFDTIGILAKDHFTLSQVASVLLNLTLIQKSSPLSILWLEDAFALCEQQVQHALYAPLNQLNIQPTSLSQIGGGEYTWDHLLEIFTHIQFAEVWDSYGGWIEGKKPSCGPHISANFSVAKESSRRGLTGALEKRERFSQLLRGYLGDKKLLCLPTTASLPPLRGSLKANRLKRDYYPRLLSLTSLSGLAALPQISLPLGEWQGVPVGLSFLALDDAFLLSSTSIIDADIISQSRKTL